MKQQSGAGLSLVNEKFSHQACDIGSQPGLCGMVELHTASNAKYIGMTQTIHKNHDRPGHITPISGIKWTYLFFYAVSLYQNLWVDGNRPNLAFPLNFGVLVLFGVE